MAAPIVPTLRICIDQGVSEQERALFQTFTSHLIASETEIIPVNMQDKTSFDPLKGKSRPVILLPAVRPPHDTLDALAMHCTSLAVISFAEPERRDAVRAHWNYLHGIKGDANYTTIFLSEQGKISSTEYEKLTPIFKGIAFKPCIPPLSLNPTLKICIDRQVSPELSERFRTFVNNLIAPKDLPQGATLIDFRSEETPEAFFDPLNETTVILLNSFGDEPYNTHRGLIPFIKKCHAVALVSFTQSSNLQEVWRTMTHNTGKVAFNIFPTAEGVLTPKGYASAKKFFRHFDFNPLESMPRLPPMVPQVLEPPAPVPQTTDTAPAATTPTAPAQPPLAAKKVSWLRRALFLTVAVAIVAATVNLFFRKRALSLI